MKNLIILQARLNSERLPEKLLLKLNNKTILEHILNRFQTLNNIDLTVIAVPKCDYFFIKKLVSKQEKTEVYWGDERDVLKRFAKVVDILKPGTVIRATADNPITSLVHLKKALRKHAYLESDYTTFKNLPLGTGVEIISAIAIDEANKLAKKFYQREHVTPFIWENKDIFKVNIYNATGIFNNPDIRMTIDTKEDYELFKIIYKNLYDDKKLLKTKDVISFLLKNPQYLKLNIHIEQRSIYGK